MQLVHTPLFAWQAWHLATWSVALRGRRGTATWTFTLRGRRHFWHWTGSGGALGLLGDIERRFAWQAWHLATPLLCVAGVALMALGWLWWRLGWIWRRGRRLGIHTTL